MAHARCEEVIRTAMKDELWQELLDQGDGEIFLCTRKESRSVSGRVD